MSQFFGIVYKNKESDAKIVNQFFANIPEQSLLDLSGPNYHIKFFGNKQNLAYNVESENSFIAVVGKGLQIRNSSTHFLGADDWRETLSGQKNIKDVEGHFVAIKYSGNRFEFYTDQLGVRTLYFFDGGQYILFSTRLNWILKNKRSNKINIRAFSSHWLGFNQLSTDISLVEDVQRLGPGGHAFVDNGGLTIKSDFWIPENQRKGPEDFVQSLSPYLNIRDRDRSILAFSGGLDSRLLFSMMYEKTKNFSTLTFGSKNHPDINIPLQIAGDFGIQTLYFDNPLTGMDDYYKKISDYVNRSNLISSASDAFRLSIYDRINNNNMILLDGAFGEIGRRHHMKRLLFFGKRALLASDYNGISKYLRVPRADFFSPGFKTILKQAFLEDVEIVLKTLPSVNEIGIKHFIDLLAIRTRLPNYYGFEQSRLDDILENYMPFAQPALVSTLLNIDADQREQGKLYKNTIKKQNKKLSQYPLIKGNSTYPFLLGTIGSTVWQGISRRLKRSKDPVSYHNLILENIKPLVINLLDSVNDESPDFYDLEKINNMVNRYYAGNLEYGNELDWFVAFEIWRRENNIVLE